MTAKRYFAEPWVRSLVEHYCSLGARDLVFLDNNSTDETVSAACEYDNVTMLRTTLPFGASIEGAEGQNLMRRYLIKCFGRNRWSLSVDMDELFDHPYSDVISLESGHPNSRGPRAREQMILCS